MYWHGQFQSAFFEAWAKAGLPHHDEYLSEYNDALSQIHFKTTQSSHLQHEFPALDPKLLDSVYGFGVIIGNICANFLGLSSPATDKASDWCGRFNLGISLFDYICDESGGPGAVAVLPVFHPFIKEERPSAARPPNPVEELLSNLASSVLGDLGKVCKSELGAVRRTGLWKAMQGMFRAEMMVSELRPIAFADHHRIRKALSLKSVEPFRVMAEWTALSADLKENQILIKNARAIGRGLGNCYWLIDDAKDVWTDLNAGRWNLFLLLAAAQEPRLFERKPDALTDMHLMRIWKRSNLAQRVSEQVVSRLTRAVTNLHLPSKTQRDILGLVSVSLWQWLQTD